MGRLFKYLFLCVIMAACAKSTGFKASDYTYRRAEKLSQSQGKTQPQPPKKGKVVRDSHRILFTPTKTDWTENNVTLKAQVQIDDKSLGEVEFTGVKTDSRIHLKPVDPELNEKIQAQLICISDEGTCTEFFIDVFYRENEVYFHDQMLAKPKESVIPAPTEESQEPKKNKGSDKSNSKDKSNTKGSKPKQPAPPPVKNEPIIEDEISDLEISEDSGFVGTPDEEVEELFAPKPSKREETRVPEKKETPKKEDSSKNDSKDKGNTPGQSNSDQGKGTDKNNTKEPGPKGSPKEPTGGNSPMEILERFRASDQAINSPSRGRLERGTDLFQIAGAADFGFEVTKAAGVKDYYSTFGLAQTIAKIAQALQDILPNRTLYVTALSKWGGGYLSPHKSHQNGTDADVRYLRNDERMGSLVVDSKGRISSNFLAAQQWKLFKKAFETNNIEMIFVGPAIKRAMCEEARRSGDYKSGDNSSPGAEILKRLVIERGHNDHFHIRVRCTDRRCSRITYNYKSVGC